MSAWKIFWLFFFCLQFLLLISLFLLFLDHLADQYKGQCSQKKLEAELAPDLLTLPVRARLASGDVLVNTSEISTTQAARPPRSSSLIYQRKPAFVPRTLSSTNGPILSVFGIYRTFPSTKSAKIGLGDLNMNEVPTYYKLSQAHRYQ